MQSPCQFFLWDYKFLKGFVEHSLLSIITRHHYPRVQFLHLLSNNTIVFSSHTQFFRSFSRPHSAVALETNLFELRTRHSCDVFFKARIAENSKEDGSAKNRSNNVSSLSFSCSSICYLGFKSLSCSDSEKWSKDWSTPVLTSSPLKGRQKWRENRKNLAPNVENCW